MAKLLQCCRLQYANFMLQANNTATRPWTGVYKLLIPDVMASEVYQNDCSYVLELSEPTVRFTPQEFSMVGGYTEHLKKPQNHQNWEVGPCLGQYNIYKGNDWSMLYNISFCM